MVPTQGEQVNNSNIGRVAIQKATVKSVFRSRYLCPRRLDKVSAVKHEKNMKDIAKEKYVGKVRKVCGCNISVYDSGLGIDPSFPFLDASHNGQVHDPRAKDPFGLLEIKCPFKYPDMTRQTTSTNVDFF